jgi:hypothetical protein
MRTKMPALLVIFAANAVGCAQPGETTRDASDVSSTSTNELHYVFDIAGAAADCGPDCSSLLLAARAVNLQETRCADGELDNSCPIDIIDLDALELDETLSRLALEAALARAAVMRGHLVERPSQDDSPDAPPVERALVVRDVWIGWPDVAPKGTFQLVRSDAAECSAASCASLTSEALNVDGDDVPLCTLDFGALDVTEEDIGRAYDGISRSGLIVVGEMRTEGAPETCSSELAVFASFEPLTKADML